MTRMQAMHRGGWKRWYLVKIQAQAWAEAQVPSSPPSPGELGRRREEAKRLEEVGRSPGSSPTKQLAQIVAGAGLSGPAREGSVRKKVRPTVREKAPERISA